MKTKLQNPKTPDGRSKKRPGLQEHRNSVLGAAVDLFRQQGSRAVSISQICTRAGISRPTFYRCFKDKDALVYALYEESVVQPVEEIMLEGLASRKVDQHWIKASLEQLFDAIFANARFAELVFMESNDPASPAYAIVNQAFDQVADVMEQAISSNTGRKPSRVFLKSQMAACQWIVHDAMRKGLDENSRQQAKAAAWELAQSVFAGGREGL